MSKTSLSIFASLMIVLAYQGCGNQLTFTSGDSVAASKSENNGDGYTGKPSPFDFRRADQPCSDLGANGRPLPNSQIFVFTSGAAQLVRENCADISPRPLSSQDYTVLANGDLLYQNQVYNSNLNQGDFDVVAASCPAGQSPLANPIRRSLMAPPLYLQDPSWSHNGLSIDWLGTLASLPVYQIQRSDPQQLEGWRRIAVTLPMDARETYVYSFFAKTDSMEKAQFTAFFPNNHDFRIEFNLMTGAPTVQSTVGVNLVGTQARLFGGGVYVNIYYQLQTASPSNLGISSVGTFLGSSIAATAIQLEKISSYCAP